MEYIKITRRGFAEQFGYEPPPEMTGFRLYVPRIPYYSHFPESVLVDFIFVEDPPSPLAQKQIAELERIYQL